MFFLIIKHHSAYEADIQPGIFMVKQNRERLGGLDGNGTTI